MAISDKELEELKKDFRDDAVEKHEDAVSSKTPAVQVADAEVSTKEPAVKDGVTFDKFASNDGTFVLSGLDDKTNVAPGNIMEAQARSPAHQQNELTVEEDAPGFDQAASLMTPRGSPHYKEGGSIAEVTADKK